MTAKRAAMQIDKVYGKCNVTNCPAVDAGAGTLILSTYCLQMGDAAVLPVR